MAPTVTTTMTSTVATTVAPIVTTTMTHTAATIMSTVATKRKKADAMKDM